MIEKIVVTRYQSLVEYLKQLKLIDDKTKIISHANVDDIRNKHVLGILPYWLACHAAKFTEVRVRIPVEKRGKELSLEEIEFYALKPQTYEIREIPFNKNVDKGKKENGKST